MGASASCDVIVVVVVVPLHRGLDGAPWGTHWVATCGTGLGTGTGGRWQHGHPALRPQGRQPIGRAGLAGLQPRGATRLHAASAAEQHCRHPKCRGYIIFGA